MPSSGLITDQLDGGWAVTAGFDTGALDGIEVYGEEELGVRFDALLEMAVNQPEETVAQAGLGRAISQAYEQGHIAAAFQMAMVLGATACLHPHLETVASEASNLFDNHGKDDGHGHKNHDDEPASSHNRKYCTNCQAGRYCPRA